MEAETFEFYKVGNKLFDDAHFVLFGILDKLRDALGEWDIDKINFQKDSFISYFKAHCRWEEGMMDSSGYDEHSISFHKAHHATTLFKVESLCGHKDIEFVNLDTAQLCLLLRDHIMVGDKELAAYINSI
jgi:hemerythrin